MHILIRAVRQFGMNAVADPAWPPPPSGHTPFFKPGTVNVRKESVMRRAYIIPLPNGRSLVAWNDAGGKRRRLHFATLKRARQFSLGLATLPVIDHARRWSASPAARAVAGTTARSRTVAPSSSRPAHAKAAAGAARLAARRRGAALGPRSADRLCPAGLTPATPARVHLGRPQPGRPSRSRDAAGVR